MMEDMRLATLIALSMVAFTGACTGGQTGEITRMSRCDYTQAVHALDALPEVADALERGSLPWSGSVTWADGTETMLELELIPTQPSVEERGFDACLHWRTEIEVDARTHDGRLASTLRGSIDLHEAGATVRAQVLQPDGSELSLQLERDDFGERGTLREKREPELDDELVATF